jgi:hypothetical protein
VTHTGPGAIFTPLRVMCAAIADTSMGGVMNLRVGRRRALHGIERDLASSDPRLDVLFSSFTKQVSGEKMPRREKVKSAPLRPLARSRRRSARRRAGEDWRAWPRAIP